MNTEVKKVFQIKNTPAARGYDGYGIAALIIKSGIPQSLIYLIGYGQNISGDIGAEEVWKGFVNDDEFYAFEKIPVRYN